MRKGTLALFGALGVVIVCAVVYFGMHQNHLLSVSAGSMSLETKKHFWSFGIDCQEIYEVQGYESPESLYKMFGLTQHSFFQLNPGLGMAVKQGDVVCIRGLTDVSGRMMGAFWPVAIGGALALTGVGAAVYAKLTAAQAAQHALPR